MAAILINSLVYAYVMTYLMTLWLDNELSAGPPRGRYGQWTEVKIQMGHLQIVWWYW